MTSHSTRLVEDVRNRAFHVFLPHARGFSWWSRDNASPPPYRWVHQANVDCGGGTDGVSAILSSTGHLEVVVRQGSVLSHWWYGEGSRWRKSADIFWQATGNPAFIQSSGGAFEVVVPRAGGVVHGWRDNTKKPEPWTFGSAPHVAGAIEQVALLESTEWKNLEMIVVQGGKLVHHWRDQQYVWHEGPEIGRAVGGTLSCAGIKGRFELLAVHPEGGLVHWRRDNSREPHVWTQVARFGEPASGAAILRSEQFGNLEAIEWNAGSFRHWWREGGGWLPAEGWVPRDRAAAPTAEALMVFKYRIGRLLGEGYFARTFEATDTVESKQVALKVYKTRLDLKTLQDDVLPLLRVTHPNVVKYLDCNLGDDHSYVATELCIHGNLRKLVGRTAVADAERYLRQLFSGLRAVHRAGVIHRDLKPENIFVKDVAGKRALAIGDFGISVMSAMTLPAAEIGSAPYMAPEQRAGVLSPKCDVWAAGLIACELLTGGKPNPAVAPAGLPSPWDRIVKACLVVDHEQRVSSGTACEWLGI